MSITAVKSHTMFEGGIGTWTCIYGWVRVEIMSVSGRRSALALTCVLAVPGSQSSCQEGNSRLCQVYLLTISSPPWVLQKPHQFLTLYKRFGFLIQNWSFHYLPSGQTLESLPLRLLMSTWTRIFMTTILDFQSSSIEYRPFIT